MSDIKNNHYYQRLAKLSLWPLVGFISLMSVIVVSQVIVFYMMYIPSLLEPLEKLLAPEVLSFLASGIEKIIINLSVWLFAMFLVNILLVNIIWNVKKLLIEINASGS